MFQYSIHHQPTHRIFTRLALAAVVLSIVFGGAVLQMQSARAAARAVLIGADLKPQFVNLQAMGAAQISYFDAERRLQIKSLNDVLQIRLLGDRNPTTKNELRSVKANSEIDANTGAKTGVKIADADPAKAIFIRVDLVDGQRLVGQWSKSVDGGETLVFRHELLGQARLKLDVLARLWRDVRKARAIPTPRTDTIALANGDVMAGFVVSLQLDAGANTNYRKQDADQVTAFARGSGAACEPDGGGSKQTKRCRCRWRRGPHGLVA